MNDDIQLVDQVLTGDRQAFITLIHRYERLVAHMVFRVVNIEEDREEVCQDVFVKVHQSLSKFNFQSKLSTWIATIAYRHALNHVKKNEKVIRSENNEQYQTTESQQFVDNLTPENALSKEDTKRVIHQLIDKLPEQYRIILTLFHLEEMSYPEIVEVTGMPEGTVKNYLFRARKQLKEHLQHYLLKEVL